MELIEGISHVDIHVRDVDEAVQFYCEGLGLRLKRRDNHNGIIETPDGVILEISPGGTDGGDTSGITHVCYNTFNVDAAFRRALDYGAVISRPKDPEPYTYKDLRMAFVRAPSGEEIEFWSIAKKGVFGENAGEGQYIKHVVHAALTVKDMKACVKFYEGLGARLKTDWEWGCSMTLSDGRELELFSGGEYARDPAAYRHLAFFTPDIEAASKRVVELGGSISHEPYDWSNLRVCFCRGIMGEVIEFFQMYNDGRQADVFDRKPDKLPNLFSESGA
jgi:catechol 2,3-dioxygenase-like lactoylglutathione lyase family enzyme